MIQLYGESNEQNRNRGVDTWNRLTAVRGEGVWGWDQKGDGINEKICIYDTYTWTAIW